MNDVIDDIKKNLDIVQYIGSFISLKKAGRNYKANCPFHHEKSASFVVSPERQIWHCFGACGDGGDIIKFAMKWGNCTFFEALKELAERAGISSDRLAPQDKGLDIKDRIAQINTLSAQYFEYILQKTPYGAKALEYLRGRGINDKIISTFQLGYSVDSWDSLLKFLKKKNFTEVEMVEAGVLVHNDQGRYYDRFRGRLMFPIRDLRGVVIGFSGRILDKGDQSAKYVNTPETALYHKRESLFGIQLAKESIRNENMAILVEGEFDMIMPFQHGISNIVSIKGSAVTKEQLQLIKRFTNNIALALDADSAGDEAIKRGIQEAEFMDFDIHVIQFQNGKDPDESVRTNTLEFKKSVAHPLPIYDFIFNSAQKKYSLDDAYGKKKIGEEVLPYISRIRNPIIQSHYIKKLSALLGVSEDSVLYTIRQERKKAKAKPFIHRSPSSEVNKTKDSIQELYVMSRIFQQENPYKTLDAFSKIIELKDMTQISYRKLIQSMLDYRANHALYDESEFTMSLPAELKAVYDELYLYPLDEVDIDDLQLQKDLYQLKMSLIKKQISELQESPNSSDQKDAELVRLTNARKVVEKTLISV
ncbi:DNA primase [Candidatus Roizmanbacteria bacterium]|nr:DNA primase [Candidatus Roizmanbacteria bacterium]